MRLACPSCHAELQLEEAVLKDGGISGFGVGFKPMLLRPEHP